MKNIFLASLAIGFLVMPALSFADSDEDLCDTNKYSIIYINGVLNSRNDASHGRDALYNKIGDVAPDGSQIFVRLAYNPSHLAGIGDGIMSVIQKTYDQMQSAIGLDYDAKEMLSQMHNEVKEGRILFVPHSQGNFYANSIYNWLGNRKDGIGTSSMTMYNVASPAQESAPNARYILSKTDKVIAGLVGAVGNIAPPNVNFAITKSSPDPLGHSFTDVYLNYGGAQMVEDIKAQLEQLAIDKQKDRSIPCIPAPNESFPHAIIGGLYSIADPLALLVRNTLNSTGKLLVGAIAAIFPRDTSGDAMAFATTTSMSEGVESRVLAQGGVRATSSVASMPSLPQQELSIVASKKKTKSQKPKTPAIVETKSDYILLLEERIALLKKLVKAQTKVVTQKIASSVIRTNDTLPTASARVLASTTPTIDTNIHVHWSIEDTLPKSWDERALTPDDGRLMITEYYIGKNGEASWVELMNTSDKWVDLREVDFLDDDEETSFPITGLPAKKFVILKSSGVMAQAIPKTDPPYRVIEGLRSGLRNFGEFAVRYQSVRIDRAPYGDHYCKNDYALRRSCERMITIAPGNKPEYWVRARALETPTQYENYSTIGHPNQSWKYFIYEGRPIVGHYYGEAIPRGDDASYVTGEITVPKGEEWHIGNAPPWTLAPPDAAIFGGAGQTIIHVYGTLNTWQTGSLNSTKTFASAESGGLPPVIETIPHVVVHEGGIFVRDPYSFLHVPVIIRGGIVRANVPYPRMRLESGTLYLTYYNDGTSPDAPTCTDFRNQYSGVEWLGGKLYRIGVDCGSSLWAGEASSTDNIIGPDDPFGVLLASSGPLGCHIFYATRTAEKCPGYDDVYTVPTDGGAVAGTSTEATSSSGTSQDNVGTSTSEFPRDAGATTTPATSTPPIEDGDTDNATSTLPQTGGGADTASSTDATTTPPIEDGGVNDATSTPSQANGDTDTASSTDATSTSPIDNSGEATSTPPSNEFDEGSGTTTPPVADSGSATSSSTTTPSLLTAEGCYEGPVYYDGISLEELNSTCGHGWAQRPTIFPIPSDAPGVRNPKEARMQITEYYIGSGGEASWFKISNMLGMATIGLGNTDIFYGGERLPFPVLSIPAREYVIVGSKNGSATIPEVSGNGGVTTTLEFVASILPVTTEMSGSLRLYYANNPLSAGSDLEILNFVEGGCSGIRTAIGSCVLERPYLVGNYPGDAGYVPWSMPEAMSAPPEFVGSSSTASSTQKIIDENPMAESSQIQEVVQNLVGNYPGDAGYVPWSMPEAMIASQEFVGSSSTASSTQNIIDENPMTESSQIQEVVPNSISTSLAEETGGGGLVDFPTKNFEISIPSGNESNLIGENVL